MKERFQGKDLIETLRRQTLVMCDERIARKIARNAHVTEFKPGQTLIKQSDTTSDLFFILQGSVEVFVHGRCIGTRPAGEHVGEMATILKSKRTATVKAKEHCVVAVLTHTRFIALADTFPKIWRALAEQLAGRLDKRRNQIREQNAKPYVFIGSSGNQKDVAEKLKSLINNPTIEVHVWSDPGVFKESDTFIETLTREAERADFAVLIFGKDDVQIKGGRKQFVPRDNVVFEAGLFIGSISRKRTFIVTPKNIRLRILSDLEGMTQLRYTKKRRRIGGKGRFKMEVDVSDVAARISKRIQNDWVR